MKPANKLIISPLLLLLSAAAQATNPLPNLFVVPELARHSAPDFVSEKLGGGNAGVAGY